MPVYVDPKLRAYSAAGLRRTMLGTLGLKATVNAARAAREGHAPGLLQGDPWQLGGVFVIAPDGRVLFEQRSDAAGDHADPEAVLDVLGGAWRA
jgi:hypothetical protein